MWVAGGQLLGLYEGVTTARDALAGTADAPDRLDHAHLVGAATAILRDWEANVPGPHPRPRWDWAVVEDIHNAPRSVLGLLAELAADGASVVTTGDPDCAVQGFRGGVASLPGDVAAPAPRGLGSRTVALRQRHRGGSKIAGVADALAEAIRVGGGATRQRNPKAAERRDSVSARRFVHPEEEAAAIARAVREARLLRGIPYSEMAVVTRSRSTHPGLRASLVRRGVPVGQIGTDRPLREEPAVDALLALIRLALDGASDNAELVRVLTGPLVGIDPLRLRQIGRILRGGELARGGSRSESELLSLAAEGPSRLSEAAPRGIGDLLRAARMFETVREAAERSNRQAEEVLWAAWESSGKAEEWREAALRGGTAGDAADSALDSVIQLFRVAQRMADRDVDVPIDVVLDELQTHNLPEDSIARAGAAAQTVTLTTPNASIGRQWEFVVVAGPQDGLWRGFGGGAPLALLRAHGLCDRGAPGRRLRRPARLGRRPSVRQAVGLRRRTWPFRRARFRRRPRRCRSARPSRLGKPSGGRGGARRRRPGGGHTPVRSRRARGQGGPCAPARGRIPAGRSEHVGRGP